MGKQKRESESEEPHYPETKAILSQKTVFLPKKSALEYLFLKRRKKKFRVHQIHSFPAICGDLEAAIFFWLLPPKGGRGGGGESICEKKKSSKRKTRGVKKSRHRPEKKKGGQRGSSTDVGGGGLSRCIYHNY